MVVSATGTQRITNRLHLLRGWRSHWAPVRFSTLPWAASAGKVRALFDVKLFLVMILLPSVLTPP
jgi:hypothetical protein